MTHTPEYVAALERVREAAKRLEVRASTLLISTSPRFTGGWDQVAEDRRNLSKALLEYRDAAESTPPPPPAPARSNAVAVALHEAMEATIARSSPEVQAACGKAPARDDGLGVMRAALTSWDTDNQERTFAVNLRHLAGIMSNKPLLAHMAKERSKTAAVWSKMLAAKADEIDAALAPAIPGEKP